MSTLFTARSPERTRAQTRPPHAVGRRSAILLALLALAIWVALPATADVLVMQDGSRVTTKGEWQVKGRQVIFTLPNGTLSAVRLSEVDLDASHVATEAANNPPAVVEPTEEEKAEQRKPVLVLTNDDIGAGPSDGADPDGDGDGDGTANPQATQATGDVVVVEWSYDAAGDDPAYQLTGRLENQSGVAIEGLQLYVDIIAVDGGTPRPNVHILREANVVQTRLEPNESTDFSYNVSIRDLEFSQGPAEQFESPRVTFDVQSRPQRVARNADDDDDLGADDADFDDDGDIGAEGGEGDDDELP